jgi:hypothetical protein
VEGDVRFFIEISVSKAMVAREGGGGGVGVAATYYYFDRS